MSVMPGAPTETLPPRPLPATYWVVPGRLLVGEHPGSQSRADAMERLRRFLSVGVTCFVDLTEPREFQSYEALLPFATPDGRRVEYLREPIPDHGVPAGRDAMSRVLAMIDDALQAGHVVYVHCRAGIGRSATVAGCWLASRPGQSADPLALLQECWQQSARSRMWPIVPETEEQETFVREWVSHAGLSPVVASAPPGAANDVAGRVRSAVLGLAVGDAMGEAARLRSEGATLWTQHTALTLCLAESLLEMRRFDARDQIERYLRWQHAGHLSAEGRPGEATPDVARALATYQWRGLPMAGSHDPRDRTTASLPRVVAAVGYLPLDPVDAVSLAAECSRTTHQSPIVLDACRYYAALLSGAVGGVAASELLDGVHEPVAGMWSTRPLRPEITNALLEPPTAPGRHGRHAPAVDVAEVVASVRSAVREAADLPAAVRRAIGSGEEPALRGALAGALAGALMGPDAIPPAVLSGLARRELIEEYASRLGARAIEREPPR
jgi:ADP-ribosyl-[dinitrogen reductase] hydrolase